MKDILAALQEIKTKAHIAKKPGPYMYERYNVFSFFESPVTFNSYARMQNAFIEALNRRICIPKYVIVLPDSNLVEASAYFQFDMAEILGICVNWLAKQFEKNLEICREDLVSK